MDSNKYNIELVSMNLTDEQFNGYCQGMEIVYWQRAAKRKNCQHSVKSAKWWSGAYEQYKHLCKK